MLAHANPVNLATSPTAATLLAQARAHLHADRYRAGRECVLAVPARGLGFAAQQEYVRLLNILGEEQRALDALREADTVAWPVPWLIECAMLASTFGDQDLARIYSREALRREPRNAAACHVDATLQMFCGDISAAIAGFERALELAPAYAPSHWALAQIGQADARRADRVRDQIACVAAGSDAEIHLQFALHHELHKLERHDEAWAALEHGCALKRRRVPYDHRATLALFDDLIADCTREFCAAESAANDTATPVFIVGMFRSGTTLLEGLLGRHAQVTDIGENYTFTAQLRRAADHYCPEALDRTIVARRAQIDFPTVGSDYLAESRWRTHGRRLFTVKLPSNFLNAGFIAKALPHAKFLHLVRDPRDVCFSNLRMLYSHVNGYSYAQRELAEFHNQYRRLMKHWQSALPEQILDVPYAELVNDTERVMRRVCDFLDLPFESSILAIDAQRSVSTASAAQIRHGIRPPGAPAWQPYVEKLQPLFHALED
jgi:tetratricopeptide (TPR) repeat protein